MGDFTRDSDYVREKGIFRAGVLKRSCWKRLDILFPAFSASIFSYTASSFLGAGIKKE